MITLRKSTERGHADHGWLDSWHSFSFADYYDPQHMGFRSLRVINEDRVQGGAGFPTHPHRDMEIITYVVSGALQHRDSLGHQAVMKAGDVQRISAGTGVQHSEFNFSPAEPVHFLQIWILPNRRGAEPAYAERSFADVGASAGLRPIASGSGAGGAISINQDAAVFIGKLAAGQEAGHALGDGRGAWVQVISGTLQVNGEELGAGDAAAVEEEPALALSAVSDAQFLLFDLA